MPAFTSSPKEVEAPKACCAAIRSASSWVRVPSATMASSSACFALATAAVSSSVLMPNSSASKAWVSICARSSWEISPWSPRIPKLVSDFKSSAWVSVMRPNSTALSIAFSCAAVCAAVSSSLVIPSAEARLSLSTPASHPHPFPPLVAATADEAAETLFATVIPTAAAAPPATSNPSTTTSINIFLFIVFTPVSISKASVLSLCVLKQVLI